MSFCTKVATELIIIIDVFGTSFFQSPFFSIEKRQLTFTQNEIALFRYVKLVIKIAI